MKNIYNASEEFSRSKDIDIERITIEVTFDEMMQPYLKLIYITDNNTFISLDRKDIDLASFYSAYHGLISNTLSSLAYSSIYKGVIAKVPDLAGQAVFGYTIKEELSYGMPLKMKINYLLEFASVLSSRLKENGIEAYSFTSSSIIPFNSEDNSKVIEYYTDEIEKDILTSANDQILKKVRNKDARR